MLRAGVSSIGVLVWSQGKSLPEVLLVVLVLLMWVVLVLVALVSVVIVVQVPARGAAGAAGGSVVAADGAGGDGTGATGLVSSQILPKMLEVAGPRYTALQVQERLREIEGMKHVGRHWGRKRLGLAGVVAASRRD